MRRLLAVIAIGALAGCTEVTRVHGANGDAYMVDCGSGLNLLDNCRDAMHRTCPDGYEILDIKVIPPAGNRQVSQAGLFRCTPSAD